MSFLKKISIVLTALLLPISVFGIDSEVIDYSDLKTIVMSEASGKTVFIRGTIKNGKYLLQRVDLPGSNGQERSLVPSTEVGRLNAINDLCVRGSINNGDSYGLFCTVR